MIQLQLLTGMRPGEVILIRGADIAMTGDAWEYIPSTHKTAHKKKKRFIFIGPKAQSIVQQFLKKDPEAHLFSPRDSRAEFVRRNYRQGARITNHHDHYSVEAYETSIRRACEKAYKMPDHLRKIDKTLPAVDRQKLKEDAAAWRKRWCWHPHQLRHNAGTAIRRQFGIEKTRTVLGHSSAVTSEIYAEMDRDAAREIIGKVG
jgi:integrase